MCIVGIQACRFTAQPDDHCVSARVAETAADPLLPSHQVEIIGFYIRCAAFFECRLLLRKKLDLQCIDNGFRNLILNFEDVGEIAVIPVRPNMLTGGSVDELGVDPDSAAGLTDAAL